MLGLYVSDHPIMGLEDALARRTDCSLRELIERAEAAASGEADAAPTNGSGRDGTAATRRTASSPWAG